MKNRLNYIFIAFIFAGTPSFAQTVTGEWYGVGTVGKEGNYSEYLSELILTQKGDKVFGEYNYYFKSAYIPSRVSGKYNAKSRKLELNIFPLLNYKAASANGADCPMQGSFILKVSKIETTLSGQFETTDPYKYTCPEINVRFKKEILTPEEKKQIAKNKLEPVVEEEDAIEETIVPGKTIAAAESKKPDAVKPNETKNIKKIDSSELKMVNTTPPARVNITPQVRKEEPTAKRVDTAKMKEVVVAKIKDSATLAIKPTPAIDPTEAITNALKKRSFEESPIIEVEADSLTLALYDNGEVDGDTIALFHNRKLLVQSQRLSDKPIALSIGIDTTIHEISMYAQNLGSIPPNTALCIIMAGDKRYELILSSTFIRNGTIRFRKKTPAQLRREKEYFK